MLLYWYGTYKHGTVVSYFFPATLLPLRARNECACFLQYTAPVVQSSLTGDWDSTRCLFAHVGGHWWCDDGSDGINQSYWCRSFSGLLVARLLVAFQACDFLSLAFIVVETVMLDFCNFTIPFRGTFTTAFFSFWPFHAHLGWDFPCFYTWRLQ